MVALRVCCFTLVLLSLPLAVRADRLQLSNGDEIEGELLEMSREQVTFRHPILGTFTIQRNQVHAIELGEQRGGNRIMADGTKAPPETPEEVIDRLVNRLKIPVGTSTVGMAARASCRTGGSSHHWNEHTIRSSTQWLGILDQLST